MFHTTIMGKICRPGIKAQVIGADLTVAEFNIQVDRKYKGEWKKTFASCKAFGKTAEMLKDHFNEGDVICVSASGEDDTWENDEGKEQRRLKFLINQVNFIPKPYTGNNSGNSNSGVSGSASHSMGDDTPSQQSAPAHQLDEDDEPPF